MIAAHTTLIQTGAVQNRAEQLCAPAPAQVNAPVRFLVQIHFNNDWSFYSCSRAWMLQHNVVTRSCPKLQSSYNETSHCGSETQLET